MRRAMHSHACLPVPGEGEEEFVLRSALSSGFRRVVIFGSSERADNNRRGLRVRLNALSLSAFIEENRNTRVPDKQNKTKQKKEGQEKKRERERERREKLFRSDKAKHAPKRY